MQLTFYYSLYPVNLVKARIWVIGRYSCCYYIEIFLFCILIEWPSVPSLSICNIMNLEKVRSFLRYNRHVVHENNRILMTWELTGKSWNDSSNTWSIPFINWFSSPTYSLCIPSSLGYSVFNSEPKCEHEYLIFMYQNLPHCHSSKQLPSGRQNNWAR